MHAIKHCREHALAGRSATRDVSWFVRPNSALMSEFRNSEFNEQSLFRKLITCKDNGGNWAQSINRKPGKGRKHIPQWRWHARGMTAGSESRKQQIGGETKGDVSFFNGQFNRHEIKDVDKCRRIASPNTMEIGTSLPMGEMEAEALHESIGM